MAKDKKKEEFPYVNVDRQFGPLDDKTRLEPDVLQNIGSFPTDLGWGALLHHRRVVVLAEAGSGKTEELKQLSDRLRHEGKAAFFIRLDALDASELAGACAPRETEL